MDKMSMIYGALLELQAEIVWDQAIRQFQENRLMEAIDQALKRRDEALFLKLTEQLREIKEAKDSA